MNRRSIVSLAWLPCVLLSMSSPRASAQCDARIDLGRGPVNLHIPIGHDNRVPVPLIILLHGYTSNGAQTESYVRLTPLSDEYDFVYAYPDGTKDLLGYRFWNATDACCNFFGSNVDDSGYLLSLVRAIQNQCNIDARRIYFVGHSNGGFMSYRMACDHSDVIAAIASVAGMTYEDPNTCSPSRPTNVLHIHGTNDTTIFYGGGCLVSCYPSAVESVEQWASFDGCDVVGDSNYPPLDLDSGIPGNETIVTKYIDGCGPEGATELWTIVGGEHVPNLSPQFGRLIVEWLLAHPKPTPCTGAEMIKVARCKSKNGVNKLVVKLLYGTPFDRFTATLSDGRAFEGYIDGSSRGKFVVTPMPHGAGSVSVEFGCGAQVSASFDCP